MMGESRFQPARSRISCKLVRHRAKSKPGAATPPPRRALSARQNCISSLRHEPDAWLRCQRTWRTIKADKASAAEGKMRTDERDATIRWPRRVSICRCRYHFRARILGFNAAITRCAHLSMASRFSRLAISPRSAAAKADIAAQRSPRFCYLLDMAHAVTSRYQ